MSMLVLHPRISMATDGNGTRVFVADGGANVGDRVGDAVSDGVGDMGADDVTTGVTEKFNVGGGMIKGVAVKMGGVLVGGGDNTGNGCGATPQISQDVRHSPRKTMIIRFMEVLYRPLDAGRIIPIHDKRVIA